MKLYFQVTVGLRLQNTPVRLCEAHTGVLQVHGWIFMRVVIKALNKPTINHISITDNGLMLMS